MRKISFILIVIILFAACSENDYKTELTKVLKNNIEDLLNYDLIVVMPGSGCTGCITVAEDMFQNNVSNERYLFVFTHNISQKNLKIKLGSDNFTKPNVIIDKDNRFYLKNYEERIYPLAIVLNKGKIVKVDLLKNVM